MILVNCIKFAHNEYVHTKYFGYVVSMIACYLKHLEILAENETKYAAIKDSVYVGSIKERLKNISVTVTFKRFFETQYGSTCILNFVDENGNVFVSFYTGNNDIPEKGDSVLLTGTVKKHDVYNEIKQTTLTRIIMG